MAKENDDTKPEGTEAEESDEDEDSTAQRILAAAQGKKPAGKKAEEVDDEEEDDLTAEAEAGASDTVPRAEMIKAIKARQAAKAKARELQAKLDEQARKNETEAEAKLREATEKVSKSLTEKYLPALIKTGAEAALLAAQPKKGKAGIPRLIKLMDLSAIEVNEELELEGVEDEVTRLQEEFPELFGEEPAKDDKEDEEEKRPAARRRPATSRSQDGADKKTPPKKRSTSELILARMRGDE